MPTPTVVINPMPQAVHAPAACAPGSSHHKSVRVLSFLYCLTNQEKSGCALKHPHHLPQYSENSYINSDQFVPRHAATGRHDGLIRPHLLGSDHPHSYYRTMGEKRDAAGDAHRQEKRPVIQPAFSGYGRVMSIMRV